MQNQKPFQVGDKVKGVYHGQQYTGTVEYARPHTMNQSYKHHIVLDAPIMVYSDTRERIIVSIWEPRESGNTIEAALVKKLTKRGFNTPSLIILQLKHRQQGAVDQQRRNSEMNKFANQYGYSDVYPFEVVKVISDKTIEVREMDAERDESVKLEWVVGGFAGHCTNQRDQKWFITSNDSNPVVRIRLSKSGVWKDKHGRKFGLSDQPSRFYDYNF